MLPKGKKIMFVNLVKRNLIENSIYKCELCPHACSRKPDLKKHIKTYHNCNETESEILIDAGFLS